MVSLCEPVILKLKLLGGEKHEYYKSVGESQKWGDQILKFQWECNQKGGFLTHFTLNIMYIHSQVPYIFVRSWYRKEALSVVHCILPPVTARM